MGVENEREESELGCRDEDELAYERRRLELSSLSQFCCCCSCGGVVVLSDGGSLSWEGMMGSGMRISFPNGSNWERVFGCNPWSLLLRLGAVSDGSILVEGKRFT